MAGEEEKGEEEETYWKGGRPLGGRVRLLVVVAGGVVVVLFLSPAPLTPSADAAILMPGKEESDICTGLGSEEGPAPVSSRLLLDAVGSGSGSRGGGIDGDCDSVGGLKTPGGEGTTAAAACSIWWMSVAVSIASSFRP